MEWFATRENVAEVTARGSTKTSVRFDSGLQADLRVVPPDRFAFALHHFTGSKDHNVSLRQRAIEKGLRLSEWGLFASGSDQPVRLVATEEELFQCLDLHSIPPERREGAGEIAEAERGPLPPPLDPGILRGAFHNHTTASDGSASLEEMARAAAALGWEYLGIADHSRASFQANGLDEPRLRAQIAAIARLNQTGELGCHLFSGIECDILKDGTLDLPDDILAELDYVVVSIHSSFSLESGEQTRRLIRAIEHPCTTIVGHLTGRLLLRRESYPLDIGKVIDAAAANGVVIEINANPLRLDMDWPHWRRAADAGVLAAINPDAHETAGLKDVRFGLEVASKAGLTASEILNTRTLREIQAWLKSRRRM